MVNILRGRAMDMGFHMGFYYDTVLISDPCLWGLLEILAVASHVHSGKLTWNLTKGPL